MAQAGCGRRRRRGVGVGLRQVAKTIWEMMGTQSEDNAYRVLPPPPRQVTLERWILGTGKKLHWARHATGNRHVQARHQEALAKPRGTATSDMVTPRKSRSGFCFVVSVLRVLAGLAGRWSSCWPCSREAGERGGPAQRIVGCCCCCCIRHQPFWTKAVGRYSSCGQPRLQKSLDVCQKGIAGSTGTLVPEQPHRVWIRREITREPAISMGRGTNGAIPATQSGSLLSAQTTWEGTTDKSAGCPGARLSPTPPIHPSTPSPPSSSRPFNTFWSPLSNSH